MERLSCSTGDVVASGSLEFLVVRVIRTSSGRSATPRPQGQLCAVVEGCISAGIVSPGAEVNLSRKLWYCLLVRPLDVPGKLDNPNPKRTMISEKLMPMIFGSESIVSEAATLPEAKSEICMIRQIEYRAPDSMIKTIGEAKLGPPVLAVKYLLVLRCIHQIFPAIKMVHIALVANVKDPNATG